MVVAVTLHTRRSPTNADSIYHEKFHASGLTRLRTVVVPYNTLVLYVLPAQGTSRSRADMRRCCVAQLILYHTYSDLLHQTLGSVTVCLGVQVYHCAEQCGQIVYVRRGVNHSTMVGERLRDTIHDLVIPATDA